MNTNRNKIQYITLDRVQNILMKLELLPSIITGVIEGLDLDAADPTEKQILNIGLAKEQLFSLLTLTQFEIWEAKEKIDGLFDDETIVREALEAEAGAAELAKMRGDFNNDKQ